MVVGIKVWTVVLTFPISATLCDQGPQLPAQAVGRPGGETGMSARPRLKDVDKNPSSTGLQVPWHQKGLEEGWAREKAKPGGLSPGQAGCLGQGGLQKISPSSHHSQLFTLLAPGYSHPTQTHLKLRADVGGQNRKDISESACPVGVAGPLLFRTKDFRRQGFLLPGAWLQAQTQSRVLSSGS